MQLLPLVLCATVFAGTFAARAAADAGAPRAPEQPTSGPGSSAYPHADVNKSSHGAGDTGFFLFTPAAPAARNPPVVVFLHGFMETEPGCYGAWIMHLVRRGNIVIYPRYQIPGTFPRNYARNAATAVKHALEFLQQDGDAAPDPARFAVLGHSCGGLVAANFAAIAADEGLSVPRAVMCVEPGKRELFGAQDFSRIHAETLLLTIAGEHDIITGESDARFIFEQAISVRAENRNLVIMQTDTHGSPWMIAGHASPASIDRDFEKLDTQRAEGKRNPFLAIGDRLGDAAFKIRNAALRKVSLRVAAMEYMGYWRLFDSLSHAAFTGEAKDAALGDTPKQRDMGKWSDGTPVKQPVVVTVK